MYNTFLKHIITVFHVNLSNKKYIHVQIDIVL